MHLLVNRDYDDCDDHDCDCDHCDDNDHDCEGDDGFFSSLCNHEKHRELKVTKLTAFSPFSNLNLRKRTVKRIQEIKSKQDPSKGKVKTKREQSQNQQRQKQKRGKAKV